jgi:carbonic anhydrase
MTADPAEDNAAIDGATDDAFSDVLAANTEYVASFHLGGLPPRAARGLALLTCMDSRIEPLPMLGLQPGDAKILRNAGARVTDDVLRTLVLARYLLGVERIMILAHSRCRMAGGTEQDVHAAVRNAGGPDTRSISFLVADDQEEALRTDVQRARSWPYLAGTPIGGFLYNVDTGAIMRRC